MSDQSVNEQQARDNRMLAALADAIEALNRLMSDCGLGEGSCFTPEDIVHLKHACLRLALVLQRAGATRGLQEQRWESEPS